MSVELVQFLIDHSIELITLLFTVIGGLFALYELRTSVKNNRANYVNDILHKINDSDDIQNFLYYVEYGNDWYTNEFHHGTPEQRMIARKADKAFFNFNYICYLVHEGIINKQEIKLICYYLYVVAHDDELGSYFLDLYQYTMLNKEHFPFRYYLEFCVMEGCISKTIYNKKYFFELMKYESDCNHKNPVTCPKEILETHRNYGNRLFINSVSRCYHCKYYGGESSGPCKKQVICEDHYWMTRGTPCQDFTFLPERWKY